ncbi:hypothetical protein NDU88_005482 [Pleurodeles waltl]|uniref:Uncharacterized protein n=1 Tax=Pleurodeles waltl TaxID=8319 RepID=A0AAV7MZG1_PLEWA|nr:hypothetical protein NDU88_005482 [Pleurodeles waltl]
MDADGDRSSKIKMAAEPAASCRARGWPVDAAAPSGVAAGDAEGAWAGLPGLSPLRAGERCCRRGRLGSGGRGWRRGLLSRTPASGPPGGLRNSAASEEDPPGDPCPANQVCGGLGGNQIDSEKSESQIEAIERGARAPSG